jgi:Tripartite tricarboxylate transporter family receptor
MARKSCRFFLATVISLSLCMPLQLLLAQEPSYKGKSLRFLVNYPAGGATDVVARLVAKYLSNHIAGNPTIVVQNMPGGGGNVGANYVYEVAKPDGLTVGVFSEGLMAREGVVVPLYQDGLAGPDGNIVRDPRAELPTFREFFKAVKGAEPSGPLADALKISAAVRSMGRFVVAPPKTPATAVEILRKGFRDTFENPEFKAESERVLRFQLVSFVGDDAAKVNAAVFRAATGPVRDVLRKMTQE